jgi:DNA-binding transcriptional MerR regulator
MDASWSLEELSERAHRALAGVQLTQSNGQVTDVPNGRTIRYYTTVGLLDRPAAHGRTALYGPRHLSQLIAIKRLQASGLTLTEVQQRMLDLDDAALATLAALPPDVLEAQLQPIAPKQKTRRDDDFWSAAPVPHVAAPPSSDVSFPVSVPASPTSPVHGLQLREGVTLTFVSERALSNGDMSALRAALAPVVDTLRARGLLAPTTEDPQKEQP